jgi:hypothetical protein
VAEPLQLHFALTRREYVTTTRAEPSLQNRVGTIVGVGLVAAGLAAKVPLLTGLGLTAMLVGLVAFALPYWRWSTMPALHDEEHWKISDEGCAIERPGSTTRNSWSFYSELVDARGVYVLTDVRGGIDGVPKRAFASEADEERFLEFGRAHVAVREAGQAVNTGWTD